MENRFIVLRRIFGTKREEITVNWRKLDNEELRNLYSLLNIIRVMNSRTMRQTEHVARMGEMRNAHKLIMENRR